MYNIGAFLDLVGDAGGRAFINQRTAFKACKVVSSDERMRPILHDGLRHRVPPGGNRLVATRSPAAVDVKMTHRGEAHDGARIGRDVHSSRPLAHDFEPAEGWKELQD